MIDFLNKNIFILAAHDDDAILMASSILTLHSNVNKVIRVLSTSDTMRSSKKECDAAYHFFRNTKLFYTTDHDKLDMRISANRELIQLLIDDITHHQIDIAISTYPNCHHKDHREAAIALEQAVFHVNTWAGSGRKIVHIAGEILQPLDQVHITIECDPHLKREAMKHFQYQEKQFPWSDAVIALNYFRALQSGYNKHFEAFKILSPINYINK